MVTVCLGPDWSPSLFVAFVDEVLGAARGVDFRRLGMARVGGCLHRWWTVGCYLDLVSSLGVSFDFSLSSSLPFIYRPLLSIIWILILLFYCRLNVCATSLRIFNYRDAIWDSTATTQVLLHLRSVLYFIRRHSKRYLQNYSPNTKSYLHRHGIITTALLQHTSPSSNFNNISPCRKS